MQFLDTPFFYKYPVLNNTLWHSEVGLVLLKTDKYLTLSYLNRVYPDTIWLRIFKTSHDNKYDNDNEYIVTSFIDSTLAQNSNNSWYWFVLKTKDSLSAKWVLISRLVRISEHNIVSDTEYALINKVVTLEKLGTKCTDNKFNRRALSLLILFKKSYGKLSAHNYQFLCYFVLAVIYLFLTQTRIRLLILQPQILLWVTPMSVLFNILFFFIFKKLQTKISDWILCTLTILSLSMSSYMQIRSSNNAYDLLCDSKVTSQDKTFTKEVANMTTINNCFSFQNCFYASYFLRN